MVCIPSTPELHSHVTGDTTKMEINKEFVVHQEGGLEKHQLAEVK